MLRSDNVPNGRKGLQENREKLFPQIGDRRPTVARMEWVSPVEKPSISSWGGCQTGDTSVRFPGAVHSGGGMRFHSSGRHDGANSVTSMA